MSFNVISTFSGCGGSSLGYKLAGGKVLLAVEWDDNAVATYRLNFPDTPIYHGDIAKLSVEDCLQKAGAAVGELDILDGSPPCQGFSTAGKRDFGDVRNQLFREYVRLLRGLQPKVFVMENVSGMVKGKMKLIFAECLRELKASGYKVKSRILNAMYFNVPQSRERMIFVGVREDLGIEPSHPKGQAKPMTVKEAFAGVEPSREKKPNISPLREKRWRETKPGSAHKERFSLKRLSCSKVSNSLIKVSGSGGLMHPDEPRLLSLSELKQIASFPQSFLFPGTWDDAVNRIGNSVPPNFMRAIAEHIRDNILEKLNG